MSTGQVKYRFVILCMGSFGCGNAGDIHETASLVWIWAEAERPSLPTQPALGAATRAGATRVDSLNYVNLVRPVPGLACMFPPTRALEHLSPVENIP